MATNYERRPIKGYEGVYEIDSEGHIFSIERFVNRAASIRHGMPYPGSILKVGGDEIKGIKQRTGYLHVTLYKEGKRPQQFQVHRLVASTFIENPHNYKCVNHLNEDKLDNRAINLEWCTYKQNTRHSIKKIRAAVIGSIGKRVEAFTMQGASLGVFETMTAAARATGINVQDVSKCANGCREKTHGYIFKLI